MTDLTTTPRNHTRLAAQSHAARGWYVLPTDGKRPVWDDWERAALIDRWEVADAWNPHNPASRGRHWNVAVACGPSGLVVLDIDRKNGRDGFAAITELDLILPATYSVRTPSGGRHLYFKAPPGITIGNGALAPGIDVRANGGIVVAVGSPGYELEDGRDPVPLPGRLCDALAGRITPLTGRAEPLPDRIPEGERETRLISLAGSMRRRGASVESILAALRIENDQRCDPPLDEGDLERMAGSAGRWDPDSADPLAVDQREVEKQTQLLLARHEAGRRVRQLQDRQRQQVLGAANRPTPFIEFLDSGELPADTCLWGVPSEGGVMVWAKEQSLMIIGPPGAGKTTLALQLTLLRTGLLNGDLLGMPVTRAELPTLYLAVDRPDQIKQSARRMAAGAEPTDLLQVMKSLPAECDLREPASWVSWLHREGFGALVVDSAKDLGLDLNENADALEFHLLANALSTAKIELVVLHHTRKRGRGDRQPLALADVHGSVWVTAGAGSVLLLDGEAGTSRPVRLTHAKPLAVPLAPLSVTIDSHGRVHYRDALDEDGDQFTAGSDRQDEILILLRSMGPMTSAGMAKRLDADPSSIRRSCRRAADSGLLNELDDGRYEAV